MSEETLYAFDENDYLVEIQENAKKLKSKIKKFKSGAMCITVNRPITTVRESKQFRDKINEAYEK